MADEQSERDRIRNKRLAKLGGPAPAPAGQDGQSSASPTTASSATPSNIETSCEQPVASSSNPVANQAVPEPAPKSESSDNPPPRKITITSKVPSSSPKSPKPRPAADNIDAWQDRMLRSIFRLTLRSDQKTDAHGNDLYFTAELRDELESNGSPLRFDTTVVDQAIFDAATNGSNGKPLSYLLPCWKRATREWRATKGSGAADPKHAILTEARRLCMSYCIFSVTMPDMFLLEDAQNRRPQLVEHLLLDPQDDLGISPDFLQELVSKFDEDESIKPAIVRTAEVLSEELMKLTMNDNFKPYVFALRNLVRYSSIIDAITASHTFLHEDIKADELEHRTILGPFFALSPLQADVAMQYFKAAPSNNERYIANSQNALRMTLNTHQDELFDIVNCIVRTKGSRDRLLDWFAATVNLNHKRRATYVEEKTVSSDGFMLNVTSILDRLCEPFMDTTFSKIDRIDIDYFRRSPRVVIGDETKINADQKTSDLFYSHKAEGTSNFISEIFFLTVAAHHYGSEAANSKLSQVGREIKHLEKEIEKFEAEAQKVNANPAHKRVFEAAIKKYKDRLEKAKCVVHAIQGVLLDELMQRRSMTTMRYVIAWLLRLVSPGTDYPRGQAQITLPLPEEQPLGFRCLPEYFVEDIVDNFKFTTRFLPHLIMPTSCEELVTICITFLRSSQYIKNPYLKSGLVTILFHGVWEYRGRSKGVLGDLLNGSEFAMRHLLHALMQFYIEAESTGTHTQFYDKFNIRYEIFQVIRCIWTNQVYRDNLNTEARVNVEFFVRFVNLLLNDVTFVLDESFTAFQQIHRLQNELESNPELSETEKQEKEEALDAAQGKAKSYMQLTNETVSMLKLFTEALSDAFTMPEVVQRLADMLDYNLESMVGPKQGNLKVRDPQQYGFVPSVLLSDIMSVYLNLSAKPSFHLAVARDGRSYKPSNFDGAARIMEKHQGLKSPTEMAAWRVLAQNIAAAKLEDDQAEEDLGDVPDEFLDPLMYTLMEDPVVLPQSKVTLDRSTIRSHLLSDPHDPFNRVPLKIEDVLPNEDLKRKIEEFKTDAKKRRLEAVAAAGSGEGADGGEPMDTS